MTQTTSSRSKKASSASQGTVSRVRYRIPVPGDVEEIAPRLRAADEMEAAAFGLSGEEGLRLSAADSGAKEECYTILVDDQPEGMFGWTEVTPSMATIWLMGTNQAFSQPVLACRLTRDVLSKVQRVYPVIYNYCHKSNVKTIAWLKWLGFEFTGDVLDTGRGSPLLHFVRKQ